MQNSMTHRLTTSNVHGLVFTGPGAGGGLDADKLDGYHASSFPLTGHTHPGTDITSIVSSATSATWALDSDKLDGLHSGAFLLSGGTAVDSDKLDGYHYSQVTTDISAHSSATTGIHGVGASTVASVANITTHAALNVSVHGVSASGFEDKANKGEVSGYASLDANIKVVQDPANATATPTASKIPIANAHGELNSWVVFQKARSYRSTAQSMPATAWAKIGIDADSYDPSNITDLTNNRIIPTKVGYYQVNGQVAINLASLSTDIDVAIYKNGGLAVSGGRATLSGGFGNLTVSDIIYCNGSTDYLELYCYVSAAKNLEISAAKNYLSVVGPF